MSRLENIFYRAVKGDENSVTELFCNLMATKYIRDAILYGLGIDEKAIPLIRYEDISTQTKIDDCGIPDIVIENREVYIYIEVKTNPFTEVQQSQLTSYPKKIKNSEKSYSQLVFLIPSNYRHYHELNNIITDGHDKNRGINIKNWDYLLEYLYNLEIDKNSSSVKEVLDFIQHVTVKRAVTISFTCEEVAIMYNNEDLNNTVSLLFKLNKLFNDTKDKVLSQINTGTYSLGKLEFEEWGQGFWLNSSTDSIFVGMNFGNEENTFSVAFETKKYNIPEISQLPLSISEGWSLAKIDKYVLTDKDSDKKFINSVVEIINKYQLYKK